NFKSTKKKLAYAYILTPSGVEQKARVTIGFLKRKMREYDELKILVEELQKEVELVKS
ncbi:MAG TPA: MarR family EPS-associated transcriptional regulator, partial [Turneriella sp.]|nr:MarR family EPS-associated transcriptional regulator [Turneriella sp.]